MPALHEPNTSAWRIRVGLAQQRQRYRCTVFWVDAASGAILGCRHAKTGGGFLNLNGSGFGAVQSCAPVATPTSLFPSGLAQPLLEAVTSDASRPWEMFWQCAHGVIVRCKHDGDGSFFEENALGKATSCGYWKGPSVYAPSATSRIGLHLSPT